MPLTLNVARVCPHPIKKKGGGREGKYHREIRGMHQNGAKPQRNHGIAPKWCKEILLAIIVPN